MKKKELNLEELDQVTGGAGGGVYVQAVSNMEDNRLRAVYIPTTTTTTTTTSNGGGVTIDNSRNIITSPVISTPKTC